MSSLVKVRLGEKRELEFVQNKSVISSMPIYLAHGHAKRSPTSTFGHLLEFW